MRLVATLVALFLGFALLAGCTEPVTPAPAAPNQFGARELPVGDATPRADARAGEPAAPELAQVTGDDWYHLPLSAGPDGAAAGFEVLVPAEAAVPTWYDEERRHIVLEVALLNQAGVESWAFAVLGESTVEIIASGVGEAAQGGFAAGVGAPGGGAQVTSTVRPFYLYLSDDHAGHAMQLVAAARAKEAAPVDFAFRFLAQDPWRDEYDSPSEDSKAFLEAAKGDAWLGRPLGSGPGFRMDLFVEIHGISLSPYSVRYQVGEVDVDETPGVAGVRPVTQVTVRASEPAAAGFTSAVALYLGSTEAGSASVDLSARGTPAAVEMQVLPAIVTLAGAVAMGDGEAESHATLAVETVGAPVVFSQWLLLQQTTLGTTIAELAGRPIEPVAGHFTVKIGPVGTGLVGTAGTTTLMFPGLPAPA